MKMSFLVILVIRLILALSESNDVWVIARPFEES
jgi:hypothetical protein